MGVRAARQEGGGAGCCGSSDRLRGERARPSRSASSGEELATSGPTEGVRPAALKVDQIPIDRVTAPDLMLIWPEEEGWPQEIGALAILDGLSLFDPHGEFLIDPIRERVNRRLHLAPRFRQILYWPRSGLGWPVWGDAASFDIAQHVRVVPVPPPGDEQQLLSTCEELRRRQLNRSRPLWEMWFLTGLADGRVGFFMKMHHAIPTASPEWPPSARSSIPSPTRQRSAHPRGRRPGCRPRASSSETTCSDGFESSTGRSRRWPTLSPRLDASGDPGRRRERSSPRDAPREPASTAESARIGDSPSSAAPSTSPRRSRMPTGQLSTTFC